MNNDTRFIFHGGATSKPVPSNLAFFKEMATEVGESPKILLVYFAQSQVKWERLFNDDRKKFCQASPNLDFQFQLADPDKKVFASQIKEANVIYVRGGSNEKLYEAFSGIKNLKELLVGKAYGGSSAGANVAAKYYYTNSKNRVARGLGLVPVKVFCHFDPEKTKELAALKNFGEKLPVYKIPESEFVVLNKK